MANCIFDLAFPAERFVSCACRAARFHNYLERHGLLLNIRLRRFLTRIHYDDEWVAFQIGGKLKQAILHADASSIGITPVRPRKTWFNFSQWEFAVKMETYISGGKKSILLKTKIKIQRSGESEFSWVLHIGRSPQFVQYRIHDFLSLDPVFSDVAWYNDAEWKQGAGERFPF